MSEKMCEIQNPIEDVGGTKQTVNPSLVSDALTSNTSTKLQKRLDDHETIIVIAAPVVDAEQKKQPDTPQDQPRRAPDSTSSYTNIFGERFKKEEWNYPDGTREERHVGHGGLYASLARYDAAGKVQEEAVVSLHFVRNFAILRRADGRETQVSAGLNPFRSTTGADGSKKLEDISRASAEAEIEALRRRIMR